jgi:nicotinamidase-related amidase
MLGGLPEKKALVYFSSGMSRTGTDNQAQMRSTVNAAIRSNVSLYPVDARGLVATAPLGNATQASPGGQGMFSGNAQRSQQSRFQGEQETLYTLASDTGGKALLDPADTVLLLLDHQSGLFQNVKDITVAELRANVTALAKLATLQQVPVITTASVPEGPNGPLMPEIQQAAPHAVYVPRKGEVNAWDNALFAKTVRETGKRTLVMAGVWTSVCVMFPALDAKAAGFKVYAVMDASGDPSEHASRTTLARFTQAGVVPTSANAVICEVHRTWNRPDAAELAELYCMVSPNYRAVMESYQKAQAVAK